MEIIQENKLSKSIYDPNTQVIYIKFQGIVSHELFEEAMKKCMGFAETKPHVALFQDLLDLKGTFTKSIPFIRTAFVPFMEEKGMKYAANIQNTDIFTKFALNQLLKLASFKHEAKFFSSTDAAKAWLDKEMNTSIDIPDFAK